MCRHRMTKKHPILAWFIRNPVAANILMFSILVSGLYTSTTMRKESFPSFASEELRITVPFRGGSPEDVERGVVLKIEEAVQGVSGIDRIVSEATANRAVVRLEAVEGYPVEKLLEDTKIQVDAIFTFPEQAEKPVIEEVERRRTALVVELFGPVSEAELKETARSIRDRLLEQPNIDEVDLLGTRDYEISIELDDGQLERFGLTFGDVAAAVRENSVDLTSGMVRSEMGEISVRTRGQGYVAEDFRRMPLVTAESGARVYVGDVAVVRDGFVDDLLLHRFQGERAVALQITAAEQGSILKVTGETKQVLDALESSGGIPENVHLATWQDGSRNIKDRLALFGKNGVAGMFLVLVSLAFFLNLRLAFWVAIGIPVSICGAMAVMGSPWLDISINVLSTFGFILVLGIVVDDAVVIGESIFAERERGGQDAFETTLHGAARVSVPATFGVLTTIAAFYPLTNIAGRMGNVFGQIATVVMLCLTFSLIESKLVLPSHLLHVHAHTSPKGLLSGIWHRLQSRFQTGLNWFVSSIYLPCLRKALRARGLTVAIFVAAFVLVLGLIPSGKVRVQFFPNIEAETITGSLIMEESTARGYTHELAVKLEAAALQANEVLRKEERLDYDPIEYVETSSSSATRANVKVGLIASDRRTVDNQTVIAAWRKAFGQHDGIRAVSFGGNAGPSRGLEIELQSIDFESLQSAAGEVKGALAAYSGVYDVKDSFQFGQAEFHLDIRAEAEAMGITRGDMANQVRQALYGFEAQRIQRGRDEVKVMVRLPQVEREDLDTLQQMKIRTQSRDAIPFSVVADTRFETGLSTIQRINRKRVVSITGYVDKKVTSSSEIVGDMDEGFLPGLVQKYPGLSYSLEGDAEQQARSGKSLIRAFGVSLIFIYALLAVALKSYLAPLTIMSAIPFGIIGAVMGHYLLGMSLSILSFFGILALNGVVVNDSLVLVSAVQSRLRQGMSTEDAVLNAGVARFRAVLLTSLTTFVGLAPILAERSMQAQFLKPMALSLASGILFATAITLFLVPVLYSLGTSVKSVARKVR